MRGRHLEGVVPEVESVLPFEFGFVIEHVCIYPANIKINRQLKSYTEIYLCTIFRAEYVLPFELGFVAEHVRIHPANIKIDQPFTQSNSAGNLN